VGLVREGEEQRHAAVRVQIPRFEQEGSQAGSGNVKASEVLECCRAVCEGLVRRGASDRKNPR